MGIKDKDQPKRNRTKYTTEQLTALERTFSNAQYPDTTTMEDLADMCGVSTEKISTWFQNRRSKFKRQSKDTNIAWMRNHIFNKDHSTVKQTTGDHVLSPPNTESCQRVPKSNLHYMPVVSSAYCPPSTPFYPPLLPFDMFNDIVKPEQVSPSLDHSLPLASSLQQSFQHVSDHQLSPLHSASPTSQYCSPLISPQPEEISHHLESPYPYASPLQSPTSDHACALNTSDSSTSSIEQTTPYQPHYHMIHQGHHNLNNYYLSQAYQWQQLQASYYMCRR